MASLDSIRCSQSLARRRERPNQAKVRSTTQRWGSSTKPSASASRPTTCRRNGAPLKHLLVQITGPIAFAMIPELANGLKRSGKKSLQSVLGEDNLHWWNRNPRPGGCRSGQDRLWHESEGRMADAPFQDLAPDETGLIGSDDSYTDRRIHWLCGRLEGLFRDDCGSLYRDPRDGRPTGPRSEFNPLIRKKRRNRRFPTGSNLQCPNGINLRQSCRK
jgi:hypothetical protein